MARGKQTCKILKEIRRQIAEANGIEFATSECRYKGDCLGTCPKCEAEVRYLEEQLRARSLAGKAIALAGISAASLAMLMPINAEAQASTENKILTTDTITATCVGAEKVRGIVKWDFENRGDSIDSEELIGVAVENLTNGRATVTDKEGRFEIPACAGDSIKVSYIGFHTKTVSVKDTSDPLTIYLKEDDSELPTGIMVIAVSPKFDRNANHYIDLHVTDEDGKLIDIEDLFITRIWIDEDGEEDSIELHPYYFDEKHPCRIYWDYDWGFKDDNEETVKEATISIEADDYDEPIIIKVKYPKRNSKKTIKFKQQKK